MAEPIQLRPLRVLIVTPKGFVGGAEKWLLSLLDGTDRLEAQVICLDDGVLPEALRARGADVTVLPTGPSGLDVARTALALRRELRRRDPDVVLANGIKAATAVAPVARWLGVPVVWVRHDPTFDATLGRLAAKLAAVVVVAPPSPDEQRRFDPVFIPPPLLNRPMPRDEARAELTRRGVPDDGRLLVGMFCRLARYKGVDTAIRALPGAPRWRLVVAGITDPGERGAELGRLQVLAAEHGVADRVSWLGEVPDAGALNAALDCQAILTRAGVPGYPDGEGFGMNLVEAYAAGIPVIGDPATVPPLQHEHYAGGAIRVDATHPGEVAHALHRLESGEGAERRRAAALAVAAAHPDGPQVADAVVTVMAALANRPGAGLKAGPPLSVVSTVFNEGSGVERLLDDVLAQTRASDEVIVVDGGSTDDTVDRLKRRAASDDRLVVLVKPGAGISEGRNIGIAQAGNEWVACTDAGCALEPAWADGLRAAAASDTADLVTGIYEAEIRPSDVAQSALAAVSYPQPGELRRQTPLVRLYGVLFGRVYDATMPTGRSMAFRKAAWQAAGGFPEGLATAEDVMFGQHVVRAGGRAVLAADAAVSWGQRESLRENLRMLYRYGIGDGQSGDRRVIGRNLVRATAYVAGPALLLAGRIRPLAVAGAAGYWSLPVKRALAGPDPLPTALAVPAVCAARDLSKACGCLVGLSRPR